MDYIKIANQELKNVLLEDQKYIGTNKWDGLSELASGVSLLLTILCSNFKDFFVIKAIYLRIAAYLCVCFFAINGIVRLIKCRRNQYTYEDLFRRINDIDLTIHPFSIIVIKNTFEKYSNKFLQTYQVTWDCDMFINYHIVKDTISEECRYLKEKLSNGLQIPKEYISVIYKFNREIKKTSVNDKKMKVYKFYFFEVKIKNFPEHLKESEFIIDDKKYTWKTIQEMEQDDNVMEKNGDVIEVVKNEMGV